MQVFSIVGYGIPRDIEHDVNYRTYLNVAFNSIYEKAAGKSVLIISQGGPTNCEPPYKGTEAAMIEKQLKKLAARKFVRHQTAQWSFVQEGESLSTLQNILYLKDLVVARKALGDVAIICEWTRRDRIEKLARKIFGRKVDVVATDFDVSENRYSDYLSREKEVLQASLWALRSEENLRKEREFFERKLQYIRELQMDGAMSHAQAAAAWYDVAPSVAEAIGFPIAR